MRMINFPRISIFSFFFFLFLSCLFLDKVFFCCRHFGRKKLCLLSASPKLREKMLWASLTWEIFMSLFSLSSCLCLLFLISFSDTKPFLLPLLLLLLLSTEGEWDHGDDEWISSLYQHTAFSCRCDRGWSIFVPFINFYWKNLAWKCKFFTSWPHHIGNVEEMIAQWLKISLFLLDFRSYDHNATKIMC